MRQESNQQKVLEYFRRMKTGTAAQAARALAIPGNAARHCVEDLCKAGRLKRCEGDGIYEFHQPKPHESGRAVKTQETIWRAIRICKTFTAWDIAMYSGASLDYVKDYLKFTRNAGLIHIMGKRGQRSVYRITEGTASETPVMRSSASVKEVRRQDLIDLGWKLMLALRDNDMATAKDINRKLEGAFDGN